ncbi:SAV_915 family protein [Streptomyces sp. DW26H14]|uniref:SAV_915 family protein n=1 Tax=Streptomyces sp. DW26H14 TaxID=3435395 RepID=UPI00403DB5C9
MSQPAPQERAASRILEVALTEATGGARSGVPPYSTPVFVPAHPRYPRDGEPMVVVEFMAHPSGGPVPVAFTSPERLAAALGAAQPWMEFGLGHFVTAMRDARFPAVRLDPVMEQGAGKWRAEDLAGAYGPVEQGERE